MLRFLKEKSHKELMKFNTDRTVCLSQSDQDSSDSESQYKFGEEHETNELKKMKQRFKHSIIKGLDVSEQFKVALMLNDKIVNTYQQAVNDSEAPLNTDRDHETV